MLLLTTDQTGDLGQLIAAVDLSRPVMGHHQRPLFKPVFLGDKYPAVDLLVDVLAADASSIGFFFVQVKSTAAAWKDSSRLLIDVEKNTYNQFTRLPIPTYLTGVDVPRETSYVVAAYRPRTSRLSSVSKAFGLRDDAVKIGLYKEVIEYLKNHRKHSSSRTNFNDI
jgi:hypothetical protein